MKLLPISCCAVCTHCNHRKFYYGSGYDVKQTDGFWCDKQHRETKEGDIPSWCPLQNSTVMEANQESILRMGETMDGIVKQLAYVEELLSHIREQVENRGAIRASEV